MRRYKRLACNGHWVYRDTKTGRYVTQSTWRRSLAQHKAHKHKAREHERPKPSAAKPRKRAYTKPHVAKPRGKERSWLSRRFAVEASLEPVAPAQIASEASGLDLADPYERHLAEDRPPEVACWDRALDRTSYHRDKDGRPRDATGRFISEAEARDEFEELLKDEYVRVYAEIEGLTYDQARYALAEGFLEWENIEKVIKNPYPRKHAGKAR